MRVSLPFICSMVAITTALGFGTSARAQNTSIDILGFKLGTTFSEARARILELKLPIAHEAQAQLKGVPDSVFRPLVMASDLSHGTFEFAFSPPPGESRLVSVTRVMDYQQSAPGAAPSAASVADALIQKFGKPTVRKPAAFTDGLVWIWNLQGSLLTKDLGTPCEYLSGRFLPRGVQGPATDQAKKLIESGCAQYVSVLISRDAAGVVSKLDQMAIDMAGGDRARRLAENAIFEATKKKNEADLQRATGTKPSI